MVLTIIGSSLSSIDFNDQWKVLIYDQDCRDIISPLLNVGGLRQKGVTLHMLLHTEREPVPDAPAVYFVRPTEQNIKRITEDCAKQLYRSIYINFVTRVDRVLMEKLAQELVASNSVSLVSKIYDQYLDVIALEPSLFTLNMRNSFMAYNDPKLGEQQIKAFMSRTATGLLSMVRVLGQLPIIRSASGGAAQMLAQELCAMLKENVSGRGPATALFEDCLVTSDRSRQARPLLLIFERGADFFPILQHTSTYQALINELLDSKLNRVTIEAPDKDSANSSSQANGAAPKKKTYDLNTQVDMFLRHYAATPFPEAVEANEKEMAEVSQRENALRARPDLVASAAAAAVGFDATDDNSKNLSDAIESLPAVLAKKANLVAHTNILAAVMKKIAARELPTYFELEQNILSTGGRGVDRAEVISLLRDGTKGVLNDKARLLALMAVATSETSSKASNEELDAAFSQGCLAVAAASAVASAPAGGRAAVGTGTGSDSDSSSGMTNQQAIDAALAAVAFLRKHLQLQSGPSTRGFGGAGAGGGGSGGAVLSSFLTSAQSRASSLIAKATSYFAKSTPFYVTRTADNLAEGRACAEDETFTYLDPRGGSGSRGSSAADGPTGPGAGQKYSDVIVFVMGGGCYSEFHNLQELLGGEGGRHGSAGAAAAGGKAPGSSGGGAAAAQQRSLRSVMYGCTDMVSGDEFFEQLQLLGTPSLAPATAAVAAPAAASPPRK